MDIKLVIHVSHACRSTELPDLLEYQKLQLFKAHTAHSEV